MPRATTASPPKKKAAKKAAPAKPQAEDPAPEDTADWFVSLDDTEDFLNVVYYGREGSAKTTNSAFMANLADKGKVLVINAEGGLKKVPLRKRGVNTDNIVMWPDPRKHERATHKGLDQIYRNIKADLAKDPNSWAGVVFDSATEIHTAILDSVQAKRVDAARMRGNDVDEDFVDIADYGTMSKLFRDVLRKFRDLNCHFVVTALERRDVDKDTGRPQYGPAVTPGLQSDLLGYVDMVVMCKAEDEDGPFRGLTRANSRYRAKDRFDVLPRVMAEPTFDRLVAYLADELTEESDPLQKQIKGKTKKAQDKADDPDEDETDDPEADDGDEE